MGAFFPAEVLSSSPVLGAVAAANGAPEVAVVTILLPFLAGFDALVAAAS